jgi:uncharacterized protein YjbJ (UPF0337 family)
MMLGSASLAETTLPHRAQREACTANDTARNASIVTALNLSLRFLVTAPALVFRFGRSPAMSWNRVIENWKQLKEKMKGKRAKLIEPDLIATNLQRHQLDDKIQERYGYTQGQVRFDWDNWLA